jgi:flagellar hook-associated protein 3 FlgL
MRITNGMVQRHVLSDMNAASARMIASQGKIASGKEISKPSDDPFAAARSLALRESIGGIRQHQRNVDDARGWQDAAESALARITDGVQRARELLTQGATDTVDAGAREAIAHEIDELIAGIKENANTKYGGQYVFSGTRTDQPAYADATGDVYQGDSGVVAREVGPGVSLGINQIATSFLGGGQASGDNKLLHVLRDVSDHLKANDGAALRGGDLKRFEAALEQVIDARAVNGARSNRLEAASSRLAELEQSTLTQISDVEDVDIAKALIDFNSQQAGYQAALRAGANIVQSSLMDFLR